MKKIRAFTLAEVLITLAIIGIVSALVIPSVLKNYNDKKYNTARLKALKTFGEAGKLASINGEINGQSSAKDFVNNVLSKYLKIVKVCDNNKASECDFPMTFFRLSKSDSVLTSNNLKNWTSTNNYTRTLNEWTDLTNTNLSVYIKTADGFSAKLFYNPKCVKNSHDNPIIQNNSKCSPKECNIWVVDTTCMNIIYDMNGSKGPNHVGEDIGFVTTFWSGLNATSAAPGIPHYEVNQSAPNKTNSEASEYCASLSTSKTIYSLPNVNELSSLLLNKTLLSMPNYGNVWSGTPIKDKQGVMWTIGYSSIYWMYGIGNKFPVWCVIR